MARRQGFEQCSKSKVCTSLKHCNCMFDNFTTCSVDEAQALQGSADLPGKVKGHCRHRVKGAPLRVVHIQPPKQLEFAQLLTIICTERPPLARMIQLLQPAVIARKVVMQNMMHRPWQDIVQQTACYESLLAAYHSPAEDGQTSLGRESLDSEQAAASVYELQGTQARSSLQCKCRCTTIVHCSSRKGCSSASKMGSCTCT